MLKKILRRLILIIDDLKILFLLGSFSVLSFFLRKRYWVICERGTDARDNGWHFYQYVKRCHPEIKVYYIIDKGSADYEKVKIDTIQYGSIKNYWVIANAKKIVSTHIYSCLPYMHRARWYHSMLGKKFYFLQHGVIPNDLITLHKERTQMRLFICGAKPEYEYIKNTFGHEEGIVQYTGLARYDNLHDIKTKKQILIMPTWRMYIRSLTDFLQSKYYLYWQSILLDERLQRALEEEGYQLLFYPHYEMQKYLSYFQSNSENIVLASFEKYDVQALLKESCLLLTDYSSVFFDFAYMRKPVLYFHFDKEDFYGKHYKEGYFSYEQMGFGEVCYDVDKVVERLIYKIKNDFVVETLYEERMKSFFPLYDNKNCERIFDRIIQN